jgi:Zn-dependent protease
MHTRIELGSVAGVPIYLDMFFLLILFIFSSDYFTSGNSQMMSLGLLIIAGMMASILLHELGHGLVAHLFKVRISHIDLTGLGGIIHFASSLPKGGFKCAAIFLAGPAVNYLLSLGLAQVGLLAAQSGKPLVAMLLFQLASINLYYALFNLLPAYPLDGGHTLDALLGKVTTAIWAQRIVSVLGLIVAAFLVLTSIPSFPRSIFMLMFAFFLIELNYIAFKQVGGFGGRRR